jgi:rod shape determining protein RodA
MALGARLEIAPRTSRRPDLVVVATLIALTVIGLILIYSVSAPRLEALGLSRFEDVARQAIFVVGGLGVFVLASLGSDRQWRLMTPYVYVLSLLLLVLVLTPAGVERYGAQRWIPLGIFDLQPSEFAKPALILALAALLSSSEEEHMPWARIGQVVLLTAIPSVLIFQQPDLGTMLVFGFVAVAMLFVAGTSFRQIALLLLLGVIAIFIAFQLDILKDYQLARLTGFLNPASETSSTVNYNQIQSQIAVASGGISGTGLFEGTLTNLAFVPSQQSDFIFTAAAEQLGFVGAVVILSLFALMLWRLFVVAVAARDRFGQLVAMGAAAMLGFHIFVNVGMTVGLLPVTGLPLPLLSDGGSFYATVALTLGITHGIWLRRSRVPGDRHLL